MGLAVALILKNLVSKKAIPAIQAFACKQCYTLASVSMLNGKIKVTTCNCK